ncbi:MAG: hypothetical protein G01um10147_798 [Microgenomates group bacterium Gr01-1014_7]|nr:MAG: hypothetical protein G01um10147_798 [Microgenomates group bacterium Gr01-1014_7]
MSIILRLKPGENQNSLLKRFKYQVKNELVIEEARARMAYVKPSQVKQEKLKEKKRKIREFKRELDKV